MALVATSVGTLDIRRGHDGPADAPWRWLISLFGNGVVGIDRIDALGLHRLSMYSVGGIADVVAERMIDGKAKIPERRGRSPSRSAMPQLRRVAKAAPARWQLIHRVPRRETDTRLVVESMVLRTGETRVDLVTRTPDDRIPARGRRRRVACASTSRGLFLLR